MSEKALRTRAERRLWNARWLATMFFALAMLLGLLTYGGFVGMNRVSGTGDYTIDQYAATDDGGLLTVTKAGTTVHVKCSADQLAAVAAQPDGTFHLSFSYSQITNSGTLKDITPAG